METTPETLVERAARLRLEALELLDEAGVLQRIEAATGRVRVVGSVDLDLVVWRDIDLYTALPPGDGVRLLALGRDLAEGFARAGRSVVRVSFNDEYRRPNSPYGEGLYLGLRVLAAAAGDVWKLDLWAWDPRRFEEKVAEHERLAGALARADRALVLEIKDAVYRRTEYRDTLTSMDVYRFALAGAGRSVADFDRFIGRAAEH